MRARVVVRAGGIAALLVPTSAAICGLLALLFALGGNMGGVGRLIFSATIGAVVPLLLAVTLVASRLVMARAGRRVGWVIFPLVALLLIGIALYLDLGTLVILADDAATRTRQILGASAYALCFCLLFAFGILQTAVLGSAGALWLASGILYIIAGFLAAPSWAFIAIELWEMEQTAQTRPSEILALLGLLFATLLLLPIACLCHGIALLRAARKSGGRRATSAA